MIWLSSDVCVMKRSNIWRTCLFIRLNAVGCRNESTLINNFFSVCNQSSCLWSGECYFRLYRNWSIAQRFHICKLFNNPFAHLWCLHFLHWQCLSRFLCRFARSVRSWFVFPFAFWMARMKCHLMKFHSFKNHEF